MDNDNSLDKLVSDLTYQMKTLHAKNLRDIKSVCDNLYTQIESLNFLNNRLSSNVDLPALRGWPASPDFLLELHRWVCKKKPNLVVETGSGATTVIIADALRRNGYGKLVSFEHLLKYRNKTNELLSDNFLSPWVDLRLGELVPWAEDHLSPAGSQPKWYSLDMLEGLECVDLLIVDGPPENTCRYARYPAVPALIKTLSPAAEIWMDDARREDEKLICKHWADKYKLEVEFFSLEKGLGVLRNVRL